MIHAPCLCVPKRLGQTALQLVRRLGLNDRILRVRKENGYIFIPLTKPVSEEDLLLLSNFLEEMRVECSEFHKRQRRPSSLFEALEHKLPPHLLPHLPHSMDIVGGVAIIEVPLDLKAYEPLIGEAIIQVHRRVKTVLAKVGAVEGTFRLRRYKVIAGIKDTETVYREHGCSFYLNPVKVYFSPRLSRERLLITEQVEGGEIVIDMFAGVGPFSIQIGKKCSSVLVYAIDINPTAISYLKKNIYVNKVEGKVLPIHGDARKVLLERCVGIADRVIMNLPEEALEYVDVACQVLKLGGGIIHYYGFETAPDPLEKIKEIFRDAVSKTGRNVKEFTGLRCVRQIAPYKWQIAIDARIS